MMNNGNAKKWQILLAIIGPALALLALMALTAPSSAAHVVGGGLAALAWPDGKGQLHGVHVALDADRLNDAPLSTDGGSVGTPGTWVIVAPSVISKTEEPNIYDHNLTISLGSGFLPGETVEYLIQGAVNDTFTASAGGRVAISSTWFGPNTVGVIGIGLRGQTSGRYAVSSFLIDNSARRITGLATAPHAVQPGGRLSMIAVNYPSTTTVIFARDGQVLGTAMSDAYGVASMPYTLPMTTTLRAAVYSSYSAEPGTLAAQSVEERADAGAGDFNSSRVLFDSALLGNIGTGECCVTAVGEDFLPGEDVTFKVLETAQTFTFTTNMNGALGLPFNTIEFGGPAGVFHAVVTGVTSGRKAYGALLSDARAVNVPGAILAPSRISDTVGTITLNYDHFTAGEQAQVFVDTTPVLTITIETAGLGSVEVPKPAAGPGHVIWIRSANGETATAPLSQLVAPAEATATASATTTASATATASATSSPTATAIPFADVPADAYYYIPVQQLARLGAISGYDSTPPCAAGATPCFKPFNSTTRAQMVKIIVAAEGFPIETPASGQSFSDVSPANPFFGFIETAVKHSIVSGYADGTFRPGANVTRGQLSKIVAVAEGWALSNPATATFRDVSQANAYYPFIETAVEKGVISGYDCGTGCREFRPGADAVWAQIAKIVYQAISAPAAVE